MDRPMGVDLKYYASHIQQLKLNSQCDKIIQPLPLATPVLEQWAQERSSCAGSHGTQQALPHGLSPTKVRPQHKPGLSP